MPARMAASLVAIGWLIAGSSAQAQSEPTSSYSAVPQTRQVLHYTKPAAAPAASNSQPATRNQAVHPVLYTQPVQKNEKDSGRNPAPGDDTEYTIHLEPPGPQQLFRLEAESSLHERMRQEARQRPIPEPTPFPQEPIVGAGKYQGRDFKPMQLTVEPNYVCYHRLYFERLNSERYGWDLGFIQPLVSTAQFYSDVALLPYHFWTDPCRNYDSNAGYCLPGDPVPYLLYPPQLSLTGAAAEGVAVAGLFLIFP
jgi:hypothetical protein